MPIQIYDPKRVEQYASLESTPPKPAPTPGEKKNNPFTNMADKIKGARMWPIPGGIISADVSDFLNNRASTRDSSFRHAGVDIKHPGSPKNDVLRTVYAPESGVIKVSESDNAENSYGPWVIILKGDSGVSHLLAHLSRDPNEIFVKVNQRVATGQKVGKYSTYLKYPHVHWEVRPDIHWHGKKIPGTSTPLNSMTKWRWTYDPVRWLRNGELLQGQFVDIDRLRNEKYPIELSEGVQNGTLETIKQIENTNIQPTQQNSGNSTKQAASNTSGLLLLIACAIGGYFLFKKANK